MDADVAALACREQRQRPQEPQSEGFELPNSLALQLFAFSIALLAFKMAALA